jgi:hypothetical protein
MANETVLLTAFVAIFAVKISTVRVLPALRKVTTGVQPAWAKKMETSEEAALAEDQNALLR